MNFNQSSGGGYRIGGGGGQMGINPSASCTGVYPRGTVRGFDPYTSLPNMMSTGQRQRQGIYGGCGYSQPTMNSRGRQQIGRNVNNCNCGPRGFAATPSPQMQMQMQSPQSQDQGRAAPNNLYSPNSGPCPINVNISAAQLASASNTPLNCDRQECSVSGTPGVKYIPMNWEDILGKTGMNGMKVSMVPSGDPGNANRQLKVSFGGQSGTMQPGETPLKVVSFQPVSTGRVDTANLRGGPGGQFLKCPCSSCRGR